MICMERLFNVIFTGFIEKSKHIKQMSNIGLYHVIGSTKEYRRVFIGVQKV